MKVLCVVDVYGTAHAIPAKQVRSISQFPPANATVGYPIPEEACTVVAYGKQPIEVVYLPTPRAEVIAQFEAL